MLVDIKVVLKADSSPDSTTIIQGQRERWTPLTKIMHLSYPRLG